MTTHEDRPEPLQALNERINQLMFRTHTTQRSLAKALGISPSAVSHKLRGRAAWTIGDLMVVCDAIGVPMASLLQPILENEESRPRGGGGTLDASRLRESNPRPIHYE